METCAVCHESVDRLGPLASNGTGGIVINTDGSTYVVHAACLMAFHDMLDRLREDAEAEHGLSVSAQPKP